jgi:hypothetical protein
MISPYLDKRIIGNYNMKVHNQIKQLFDPKDVLNPSSFFYIREKYEKSIVQKMKDKSKGINYILSRWPWRNTQTAIEAQISRTLFIDHMHYI